MYWRVRKITPEQVAKQYSVHAILIVSVLFNLMLFSKVSSAKAINGAQKQDFTNFARQVTAHLFDANYLTFADSMSALQTELTAAPLQKLKQAETIPRDADEMKAMQRQLSDAKSVSCIKFESVDLGPQDKSGFLPVDVKIKIVVHDAQGVRPSGIKLHYLMGNATTKGSNDSRNVVVDLNFQFYDVQAVQSPS